MKKLKDIVTEIENDINAREKQAHDLSLQNTLPTISTALGTMILNASQQIKQASRELTYEDLADFIERAKNVRAT